MKGCKEFSEKISCLIDNELSEDDKAGVMAHIEACPECKAVYVAYKAVSEEIGLMEAAAPEEFTSGVMYAVRLKADKPSRRDRRFAFRGFTAAAAVIVIVVFAISRLSFSDQTTDLSSESAGGSMAETKVAGEEENTEAHFEIYSGAANENYGAVVEEGSAFDTITSADALPGEVDLAEPAEDSIVRENTGIQGGSSETPASGPSTTPKASAAPADASPDYYGVLTICGEIPEALESYDCTEVYEGAYNIIVPAKVMLELLDTVEYEEYYELDTTAGNAIIVVFTDES